MLRKLSSAIILTLLLFGSGALSCVRSASTVSFGEVQVTLYILAIDGVSNPGIGDMNRAVAGAAATLYKNTTHFQLSSVSARYVRGEIVINVSASVVDDWDTYKQVLETASNAIIVNAHGETIPIPADYSKEDWMNRIGESMAVRNMTWVHTAGYPFWFYYHQALGEGEWGDEGFKQLMNYIGKENVTCYRPYGENKKISMNEDVLATILWDWPSVANADRAERGSPLNVSDFKDSIVSIIWGAETGYWPGAIVKFAFANQSNNYGFYVHIGTNRTFQDDGTATDGDYYRGYVGTAQAIYTFSLRVAADTIISGAETAISEAESDGRTKELDVARQLLQQAKENYNESWYGYAIECGNDASKTAAESTIPGFLEGLISPLIILGIAVMTTMAIVVLIISRKHSRDKKPTK